VVFDGAVRLGVERFEQITDQVFVHGHHTS
jgi:hypothetical protein